MEQEKVIMTGMFNGQTTKKDGLVDIKFKFVSDELVTCLSVFKLLGKPLQLAIRLDGETTEIGKIMLSGFSTDKDAVVSIKFTGESSSLDMQKLTTECINKLIKVRVQNV